MSDLVIIMSDCHIDNRSFLYKELSIHVSKCTPTSDDLLVSLAFDRWGEDCTDYLLGDYAFAIRNSANDDVFCFRDPLGIKPFYYSFADDQFLCSSNLNELSANPAISHDLDKEFIAAFLKDKFFSHKERTFFKAISKLPPGHTLKIESGKVSLKRYWFPENVKSVRFPLDSDYQDAFIELYTLVIKDYVNHPKPLGIELSGGLDSSSIAVLAARELSDQKKEKPMVYTWQPAPHPNPSGLDGEFVYDLIDEVCNQEALTPQHAFPSEEDIRQYLQADPSHHPTSSIIIHQIPVLKKAKKQGVSMILSGWGGDECVTSPGYGYYNQFIVKLQWLKLYKENSKAYNNPLHRTIGQIQNFVFTSINEVIRKYLRLNSCSMHFAKSFSVDDSLHREPLVCLQDVRQVQIDQLMDSFTSERLEATAAKSAEYGIHYRYPLLDRRLIEFCLGLPSDQFVRGKTKRWLARTTFAKILPSSVCNNTDKSDFLRCEAIKPLLYNAAKKVSKNSISLTRSKYVDTNKLITYLDSDKFKADPQLGKIRNALHILNIKGAQ